MGISKIIGLLFPLLVLLFAIPLLIWILPDDLSKIFRMKRKALSTSKKESSEVKQGVQKESRGIKYLLPSDIVSGKED